MANELHIQKARSFVLPVLSHEVLLMFWNVCGAMIVSAMAHLFFQDS